MFKKELSQQGKQFNYDIIVIGSGISGLSYILETLKHNPSLTIALISKKTLDESNSKYAQGGVAAVEKTEDSLEQHIQDTLNAGDGLCNENAVKEILAAGPEAVQNLIQHGVEFDKDLAREGGHSQRRIFHVGDKTGLAIINALIKAIKSHPQVTLLENHIAVNLITQTEPHTPAAMREVIGTYVLEEATSKIHTFLASAVVLATGGAGKVYRYTSNPETATGDGIAMAYRAGARIGNMEFYQFHPTVFHHHKLNNFLLTEALRGEGAYLLHPETGERFMQRYDKKRMELSTRDVVARAIFTEIEHSTKNFVYLDIRHRDKAFLQSHFPTIYNTLLELGLDLSKDLIPVVPAAHYLCGGILTNVAGETDIKRLYAIGETAFTGLHGANRLASNSLIEGVVMAKFAAEKSVKCIAEPVTPHQIITPWNSSSTIDARRASQINAQWRGLRGEMTSYAGIVRTEAGLRDLLKLLKTRCDIIENYYWKHQVTTDLVELRNIALVARLIVQSALDRHESRGGHYREDYPKQFSVAEESTLQTNEVI